jgi:UDP-N-acetylmuramate dehydrogenase
MYSALFKMLPPEILKTDEAMKKHTTFQIGGPVDLMILPRDVQELKLSVSICGENRIPVLVMGRGSNLLVRDKGIRGIVIKLDRNFNAVKIQGTDIWAQAGIMIAELSRIAANESLSGLEFAEGIPGSLGGAVVMNAGAYEGEMQDIVTEVEAISPTGEIKKYLLPDIGYAYRKSCFQDNGFIVIAARLHLKADNKDEIQAKMQAYAHRRKANQPLGLPSAGSVFKRPTGFYVGPMIEKLGFKGHKIGGAEVSRQHAGFIVNAGDASASDVLQLIELIQSAAREQYGVELHPEIRVVGEE